jgi:hypothetical protein
MRRTGFALEDRAWWLRLNLAFGALFPGWPGEIYFAWRRPARETAAAPFAPSPGRERGRSPTPSRALAASSTAETT